MRAFIALVVLLCWATPVFAVDTPRRVASLNVCTDEYVFRLLPKEKIAALSYLAADRHPVVSTIADQVEGIPLIRQSAEELLAVKPDLVVIDAGASARLRAISSKAQIPVVDVPWANSLDDIRNITRMLAARFGTPEKGEELLAAMDQHLAVARAKAPQKPVRALMYQPNGYTLAGGVAEIMMQAGGLLNVAPGMAVSRQGTIPMEIVVTRAPELLILGGDSAVDDSRARNVLHHPALATLPSTTHIEWLPLTSLICPGPWSVRAAEDFAQAAARLP